MSEARRVMTGLLVATLFPATMVGMASLAPLLNDRFVSIMDGRFLTFGWWMSIPLSVAVAITISRKSWTGVVLGFECVLGFIYSLALVDTTPGVADLVLDPSMWGSSTLIIAVPWAVGMLFGTTSLQRRPNRMDGTVQGDGGAGAW